MEKKTVLAVDDNKMQLGLFKKMLSGKYDLVTVDSAADAVKFFTDRVADVILLDITMPNISGFEFLNDIRVLASCQDLPIIIVSGNTGADFMAEARNSSAFDILIKPVNQDDLIKVIEKALAKNV